MNILVAGTMRSASTWTSRVLAQAEGARLVNEPDSYLSDVAAAPTLASLGFYAVLGADDTPAPEYVRLWELAFSGGWPWARWRMAIPLGRRIRALPGRVRDPLVEALVAGTARMRPRPGHVVVKSVNCALALDWVATHFDAQIVLTLRNPMAIVSSWLDIGIAPETLETIPAVRERYIEPFALTIPDSGASNVERVAWTVGLLDLALRLAARSHPGWHVVHHEELCADPRAGFERLFAGLGLPWTPGAADFVNASNRPGEGFETFRVTRDAPLRWQQRLRPADRAAAEAVLESFSGAHATQG